MKQLPDKAEIFIESPQKTHTCPCCGNQTDCIHDYRLQTIKDLPAFDKPTVLILRKRRYRRPHYGKRFFENNLLFERTVFKVLDSNDSIATRKAISYWIIEAQNSGIKRFFTCGNTLIRWSKGIFNSFDCKYTNGFTKSIKTTELGDLIAFSSLSIF